jgi:cytochrome c6
VKPLDTADRVLAALMWLAAIFVVIVLFAGPSLIGADKKNAAYPATKTAPESKAAVDGKQVFDDAGCASCHTLASADASGSVGPNLDDAKPSVERVSEIVKNGSGAMPSFSDDLSDQEIAALADFVASTAQ